MASLAAQIDNFAEELGHRQTRAIQRIIRRIGRSIIVKSPIDTGLFVSNWFYSHTTMSTETTPATRVRKVNDIDQIPKKAADFTHYITNNLPYAWRLETGWSKKQAPNGIIGLIEAEFQGIVETVAGEG